MMKKKFKIEGMTCSACQVHIDKTVRKIDGVKEVNVNLLTNSMDVEFENIELVDAINEAVKKEGYKSSVIEDNNQKSAGVSLENKIKYLKDEETPKMVKRLILSFAFLVVLAYLSMGFMMGWPISFYKENLLALGLTEMILSAIIIFINKDLYLSGFKNLIHKTSNKNTLVALGSGVAFVYSVCIFILMIINKNNDDLLMKYTMNLAFETAGMVPTLITIGKTLESYSKGKTTNALKAMVDLAPKEARVIKEGVETAILASDVAVDDVFIVKPGETFPVDGVVINGISSVDESSFTGESIPVEKQENDSVYMSTINQNGTLTCKATKIGVDTSFGKIITLVEEASSSKAPISKIADVVSGIFVPTIIGISLLVFVVWLIIGFNVELDINENSITYAVNRAISVLVIACPCALGLATPVAIMVGSGKGAKLGVLFKTAESIEETGKVNIVVLDKTGTITTGTPEVTDVISYIDQNVFIDLIGSLEEKSSHPLAKAIYNYAKNHNYNPLEVTNFETLPGKGVLGFVDKKKLLGLNAREAGLVSNTNQEQKQLIENLSSNGKTPMVFVCDGNIIGMVAVRDEIKEDSIKAIQEFKRMGVVPVMLTGDNQKTAQIIAKEVGIDLFVSDVLPNEKGIVINKLKNLGKVAMIGDGINDSLALTTADIGIAIGAGADVAIDSASVILVKSSLMDAVSAIKLSRQILKNIKENLFWAFFYNLIMITIAAGTFYALNITWLREMKPWYGALAMSLSSIFVVLNSLRLNLFNPSKKTASKKQVEVLEEYLLEFKKDNSKENIMKKVVISVEGMMCNHCKKHVEDAAKSVNGVKSAEASLENKNLMLEMEEGSNLDDVKNAIKEAGYEAK